MSVVQMAVISPLVYDEVQTDALMAGELESHAFSSSSHQRDEVERGEVVVVVVVVVAEMGRVVLVAALDQGRKVLYDRNVQGTMHLRENSLDCRL